MDASARALGLCVGLFMPFALAFGQGLGSAPAQAQQKEIRAFSVGVAVVKEPFSAELSKPFVGRFSLPPGTALETLQAQGFKTSLVRRITAEEPLPMLMEGDEVRLFTNFNDGTTTFEGVVINPEGWGFQQGEPLCIQSKPEGNPLCLPGDKIAAISILSVKEGVPLADRFQEDRPLTIEVQGIPETAYPYITYLVRGALSWEPLYTLELTTGELAAFASTENAFDFGKTKITFVMGEPYLIGGYVKEPARGLGVEAMAVAASPPPQRIGESWEYPFEGTVELKKGESLRLPLFEGKLTLKNVYTWDGGNVLLKHEFTNGLDRPLAEGRVECYEDGLWVGEDSIPWVAVSQKGEVTSQYAKDIEIEERTTQQKEEKDKRTTEKEVRVINHKQEAISIEVIRILPYRANLISANPKPEQDGEMLTWRLELKPGETKTARYAYEVLLESQ